MCCKCYLIEIDRMVKIIVDKILCTDDAIQLIRVRIEELSKLGDLIVVECHLSKFKVKFKNCFTR